MKKNKLYILIALSLIPVLSFYKPAFASDEVFAPADTGVVEPKPKPWSADKIDSGGTFKLTTPDIDVNKKKNAEGKYDIAFNWFVDFQSRDGESLSKITLSICGKNQDVTGNQGTVTQGVAEDELCSYAIAVYVNDQNGKALGTIYGTGIKLQMEKVATDTGTTVGPTEDCPDGYIKIGAAAPGSPNCLPKETAFPEYISMIYTLSITLAIILAVIMVIYGGYKYMTSGGNPETTAEAKDIILGAIVGLVLLVLAALLLRTISPSILNVV